MKIPVIEIGNGGFQVSIDLKLYSAIAITAAIYKYTDKYYIYQQSAPHNEQFIDVIFEAKDDVFNVNIVKEFCNDLIDQQLRQITTEKYGHIRDLIVEEAFKPLLL